MNRHQEFRRFGPKKTLSPGYPPCVACKQPFEVGDYSTLIALGPGDDEESQERCREGRSYNAVAVEAHWACVTGETD